MNRFRDFTIRTKLTLALLGISSVAVLAACLMFYVLVMNSYRQEYQKNINSLASIIGANCTAALSFAIPENAEQVLGALRSRPSIVAGQVFDERGVLFASYGVNPSPAEVKAGNANATPVERTFPGHLLVREEIILNNSVIGSVVLLDDMRSLRTFRSIALTTLAVIVTAVLILALLAAAKLREIIARPISELDAISRVISVNQDYSLRAVKSSGDEVGHLVDAFNSMLDQIARQTSELQKREERFRGLVEQAVDGFFLHDIRGRLIDVNQRVCDKLGYTREELLTMSLADIDIKAGRGEYPENLWADLRPNEPITLHSVHRRRDGSTLPVEVRVGLLDLGKQQVVMALARDVSERLAAEQERRKLESQLQQSQKMESIGTLAAGIAHDFNNILSPIYGYLELALLKVQDRPEVAGYLGEAHRAAGRARDMVKQILTFSRRDTEKQSPVEVHVIVKEALKLLRATIPSTIEIRQHIDLDCGCVLANPTQIHQILMNLCTNAYHAMREKGGVLGVSVTALEMSPRDAQGNINLKPGPYLLLEVSDSGHGMDDKTMARIFEPYYTTKGQGEGTGMGLSVVHGIVKSHGGDITVYSEPGKGSTFRVYLPVIEPAAAQQIDITSSPPPGGNERILLVDDEETVRRVEKDMLINLGYRVDSFSTPEEALNRFRQNPRRYDLAITDMTMPKMTGDTLSRELLAIRPDLPIVLCTGFSEMINRESAMKIGIRQFVTKPLMMNSFALILRDILDSPS
ncbi:MAG: ATP-binding protein [Desulfobulbaceae bacterium]|jgi:PAS domain S-box-containing protein